MRHKSTTTALSAVAAAALVAGLYTTQTAEASDWPHDRLTIVMIHSLGGGQDRMTRSLAEVWEDHLGARIVVDPRDGASGRVGMDYFLRQAGAKDGRYAVSANLGTVGIMYVDQEPPWNWEEELYAVNQFALDPAAIFVHKDSPFQTIEDFINTAKERPVVMGTSRWGSVETMMIHEVMDQIEGVQIQLVGAGGGSAIVTQVLGGHYEIGIGKVSNIQSGGDDLRYLAVTANENLVPGLTNNAPTFDSVFGTETSDPASLRSILVHKAFRDNHPDLYEHFEASLLAAKRDPRFIRAAEREGVGQDLLADMTNDQLLRIMRGHWRSYRQYSHVFN